MLGFNKVTGPRRVAERSAARRGLLKEDCTVVKTSIRRANARQLPPISISAPAENVAIANGLTQREAIDLTAWLRKAGYLAIQVTAAADKHSVRWQK